MKLKMNMIYNFIIAIIILIASSLFFIQPKMYDIVNGQTIEDERIENTLEKIKEGTQGISERMNSSDNIPKSTNSNTTSDGSNLQYNQIEYKIYESNAIGVKFKILSTWDIREYNSTKGCFWGEIDPIFITSFNCIIRIDNNVSYPHNFEFIISKHSTSNYSLTDYLSLAYESTKQQAIKNQADVSFINDKETTIQNNPAWQIEYRINSGISQYKQMDIVTKVNNTFYGLVYLQENPSDYSKYLPEFENFVKSIEFIPSIEPKPSFLKYSTLGNAINK